MHQLIRIIHGEASLSRRFSFSQGRKKERRGMLGLKQQDLYHLESNLCQLCLQVKRSNLTARVSTWGCGHVQGELTGLEFV